MAGVHGAGGDAAGLRTFEDAKSTLYGTISAAGAALEKASKCVTTLLGCAHVAQKMLILAWRPGIEFQEPNEMERRSH